MKRTFCILAFAAISVGSARAPAATPSASTPAALPSLQIFTGQEIFEGVFFGLDPVASLLPELHNNPLFGDEGGLTQTDVATELRNNESDLLAMGETELAALAGRSANFLEILPGLSSDPATSQNLDPVFRDAVLAHVETADPTFFSNFATAMQSGDHVQVRSAMILGATLFLDAWEAYTILPGAVGTLVVVALWVAIVVAVAAVIATVAVVIDEHSAHPGAGQLTFDQAVDLFTLRLGATTVPAVPPLGVLLLFFMMLGGAAVFTLKRVARPTLA